MSRAHLIAVGAALCCLLVLVWSAAQAGIPVPVIYWGLVLLMIVAVVARIISGPRGGRR